MNLVHSHQVQAGARKSHLAALLDTLAERQLRAWVDRIAVPRHFVAERDQNRATADWLSGEFQSMGLHVERQGECDNLVAMRADLHEDCLPRASVHKQGGQQVSGLASAAPHSEMQGVILVGAHYDSVPGCPGADDNGSAVAALLGCAAACSQWRPTLPVVFVAFNREEDHLKGSRDFVKRHLPQAAFNVQCAHILEMVGYASAEPGSQRVPRGLPLKLSDRGDFLGLLANGRSARAMNSVLQHAATYVPALPVIGLHVKLGLEKHFPVLHRSDHAPFWAVDIPALMWTDTSEFRNRHYHQPSDTPDTLNYGFLCQVTRLLTATVILQAQELL